MKKILYISIMAATIISAQAGDVNVTIEDPIAARMRADAEMAKIQADIFNAAQDREAARQERWVNREHAMWHELIAACKEQNENNQARYAQFRASINNGQLVDGDRMPLANAYDDERTIRVYLHDSGYNLNDVQIQKISDYMHSHLVKHISELDLNQINLADSIAKAKPGNG